MDIEIRLLGGVDVIRMSGPAVVGGHELLRASFRGAIEEGRKNFILNLTRATSLDSLLIGEMVACYKRARERGGDIRLVISPEGIVHSLLQMTALDEVFQIYGDESEAAAAFTTGPV